MSAQPLVIEQVVNNDLCTGCGLCTYTCPSKALEMKFNDYGFLVPELTGACDEDGSCITVCPFNPKPAEEVKDETAIADIFLTDGTKTHDKLGRLIGIYAAYSNEYRETSSSGGIATYIFDQLLDLGIVDHVFTVRSVAGGGTHYQYQLSSNKEELRSSSKTKYYPVTLATVLPELDKLEGKVAVVGVACFVKAIRLAQHHNSNLKEKIPFIAGIICGGVKSSFFTEYLASKTGTNLENIKNPEYRIKDASSTASNYSFGCTDNTNDEIKTIKMREVGDMWGTGLFKANACDFCDDVVTELADISLGDAWLEPYSNDGKGTSVIITRSPLADTLIQKGMANSKLYIEAITPDTMRASQQGSYNHRHEGLYVRLKDARKKGVKVSEKRYGKEKVSLDITKLQRLRQYTRKKSLITWKKTKNATAFDAEMKKTLKKLKLVTRITHIRRKGFKHFIERVIVRILRK